MAESARDPPANSANLAASDLEQTWSDFKSFVFNDILDWDKANILVVKLSRNFDDLIFMVSFGRYLLISTNIWFIFPCEIFLFRLFLAAFIIEIRNSIAFHYLSIFSVRTNGNRHFVGFLYGTQLEVSFRVILEGSAAEPHPKRVCFPGSSHDARQRLLLEPRPR